MEQKPNADEELSGSSVTHPALSIVAALDSDDLEPEYETKLDVPCTVPLCIFTDAQSEPALLVATVRTQKDAAQLREYGINTDHALRSGPFLHRCLMSIPVARTLEEVFAETQDVPLFVALPTVGATCYLSTVEPDRSKLERPLREWLTPCTPGVAGLRVQHGLRVHFAAFGLLPTVEVHHG